MYKRSKRQPIIRSLANVRNTGPDVVSRDPGRRRPMPPICGMLWLCLMLQGCNNAPDEVADSGIWFFVLVKSSNHAQARDGELTLLNYHFFSEIFPKEGSGELRHAQMIRHDAPDSPMSYENRGSNYYIEGGHFQTQGEVDAAYPNGTFRFEIVSDVVEIDTELDLSGPDGATDIPEPIQISLYQGGQQIDPLQVDVTEDLQVRWSDYSNGSEGPNGIVDDMIFVVVQDCRGERIVHTGLPFKESNYLTFRADSLDILAGTMQSGEPHAMFVEFPHVVDSVVANGVPGFTSYATATYLDIHTMGKAADSSCLDDMPPMDTGQTDDGSAEDED